MTIAEYEKTLFSDIVSAVMQHEYSSYIDSIVLTGSFGRGEPTYLFEGDDFTLKSDVEIALVFTNHQEKIYKVIKAVKPNFKEDLNFMTIRKQRVVRKFNFNYGIVSPKYNTIFMYDFYNGSKVLYGNATNIEYGIDIDWLDPYEGKRIVANRIAEMVYLSKFQDKYTNMQWKCKIVLAIVSAWLMQKKLYVSSYFAQRNAVREHEKEFTSIYGKDFLSMYYKAFSLLRMAGEMFEFDDKLLHESVTVFYEDNKEFYSKKSNTTGLVRHMKIILKYIKKYKNLNIFNLEDRILDSIIRYYCEDSEELEDMAEMWHNVIY